MISLQTTSIYVHRIIWKRVTHNTHDFENKLCIGIKRITLSGKGKGNVDRSLLTVQIISNNNINVDTEWLILVNIFIIFCKQQPHCLMMNGANSQRTMSWVLLFTAVTVKLKWRELKMMVSVFFTAGTGV